MNRWLIGARPRTLPAAVVPVVLGSAAAVGEDNPVWWRVAGALVVSLALQVGVNYANDYSDGVRGTDAVRVGPTRLVASGLAPAAPVKRAALTAFGIAAISGLVLASVTSWWLLAVGGAALLAGWGYTGGPKPYGYFGLGELFVFVFFGLVATVGTTYVVCERITNVSWLAGCMAGCLACALLVINNLRDIPTDTVAGKRTLAVRIGDRATRVLYVGLLVAAFGLVATIALADRPWAAFGAAGVLLAIRPVRSVLGGAQGAALISVLGATGKVQLVIGALTAAGIAFSV